MMIGVNVIGHWPQVHIYRLEISSITSLGNCILRNSITSNSFVFTELANTMKYGEYYIYMYILYILVFTEWCHCISQNKVWGRGCYIILFSPSDVTAFHKSHYTFWLWPTQFSELIQKQAYMMSYIIHPILCGAYTVIYVHRYNSSRWIWKGVSAN